MEIVAVYTTSDDFPIDPVVGYKHPVQGDTYTPHWEYKGDNVWDFISEPKNILWGTGDAPAVTGLIEGTVYFKYI